MLCTKNTTLYFSVDVGYDGVLPKIGFVNIILNLYFTEYFPRAAALHKTLEADGYTETFKYTTHPWLVSLYLDCPPNLVLAGIKLKVRSQDCWYSRPASSPMFPVLPHNI